MMKNSIKFGLLICTLFLAAGRSSAHDKPDFYANSLTLNGHLLDHNTFWLNKHGVLALVEGDPQSPKHKPVLFRVSLRRSGKVVKQWPANQTDGMYSLQLDELWLDARLGDELIVEPVDASKSQSTESPGKRVIQLRGPNWLGHCLPRDNC
ncbi:MAG TPA: hypothetical protein VGB67_07010 [Fibrella sp.]